MKHLIVWCIEAPDSHFLKEVTISESGQRLLFTDRWDDEVLQFGTKGQADEFAVKFGLEWLTVTEHLIMG